MILWVEELFGLFQFITDPAISHEQRLILWTSSTDSLKNAREWFVYKLSIPVRLHTFLKEHETITRLFCWQTIGPIKQPQLLIMSGCTLPSNLCPKRYKSSYSNWLHSLMRETSGINLLSLGHITLCFARHLCEKCLRDTTSPTLTDNCVIYILIYLRGELLVGGNTANWWFEDVSSNQLCIVEMNE